MHWATYNTTYFLENSLRNSASCTSSNFRSYRKIHEAVKCSTTGSKRFGAVLVLFGQRVTRKQLNKLSSALFGKKRAQLSQTAREKLPKTHLRSTTKFHWNCKYPNFRSCNLASETRCSVVLNLYKFGLFWFFSARYWPENSSTSLKQSFF